MGPDSSAGAAGLGASELGALAALIRDHCGLKVDAGKLEYCLQRAAPDLGAKGALDLGVLLTRLAFSEDPLWSILLPFLTVNETYFLREAQQLADFTESVLPGLKHRAALRGEPGVKLLSAACSTGEEAYTLAMLLSDAQTRGRVLGIDIDHRALLAAEVGSYGAYSFRGVSPEWRAAHFEPAGAERWCVKEPYRTVVGFKRANLLQLARTLYPQRFDAIFCRNALIYFERSVQLHVIRQLGELLVPGGRLFLGHSELFFDVDLGLEVLSTERSTSYQRREAS